MAKFFHRLIKSIIIHFCRIIKRIINKKSEIFLPFYIFIPIFIIESNTITIFIDNHLSFTDNKENIIN